MKIKLSDLIEIQVRKPGSHSNPELEKKVKQALEQSGFDEYAGDPYWEGVDKIVRSPKVLKSITDRYEEALSEFDEEDRESEMEDEFALGDIIDLEVMSFFWPTFFYNLDQNGITYDFDNGIFIDEEDNELDPSEVFDFLDYSSDIGENIMLNWEDWLEGDMDDSDI
jgi:hypothetical protein